MIIDEEFKHKQMFITGKFVVKLNKWWKVWIKGWKLVRHERVCSVDYWIVWTV